MVLSLKLFVASLIVLPAIDYFWLSNMANFYVTQYGDLARLENGQLKVLYFPAIVVYFLLALGLVFFVEKLVDMAWGTVLNIIAATALYLLRDKIA